jgi:hypothetical protein
MSQSFEFIVAQHRAFGQLATFRVAGHPARRFTKDEAAILSRALRAVARGASSERQIFMSPIASDHDFEAFVTASGLTVRADGFCDVLFSWSETLALSAALAAFAT